MTATGIIISTESGYVLSHGHVLAFYLRFKQPALGDFAAVLCQNESPAEITGTLITKTNAGLQGIEVESIVKA